MRAGASERVLYWEYPEAYGRVFEQNCETTLASRFGKIASRAPGPHPESEAQSSAGIGAQIACSAGPRRVSESASGK